MIAPKIEGLLGLMANLNCRTRAPGNPKYGTNTEDHSGRFSLKSRYWTNSEKYRENLVSRQSISVSRFHLIQ